MKLRYKGGLAVGSGLTIDKDYEFLGVFPVPGPKPTLFVTIWDPDSKKWTMCPLDVFEPENSGKILLK